MANEFIARNGITSLGNIVVSGSLTATGAITVSGSIASASFATNAATASSADNLLVRSTLTAQTLVVQTITSSVDFVTGSTRFGSLSSNTHQFTGSVGITGSLVSTGSIITVAPTGNANLIIQTLQASQNTQIQFLNTARTVYIGNQITSTGSMFEVHDASLGTSRLFISASGNVGIGTITPTTLLHVSGTTGGLFEADGAAGVNALYVSSSGRVGIGTTSPLSLLDVNVLASGARRLLVNYDDSLVTIKSANASATGESLRIWGDNIYFYTGSAGSELMRLTNTGRVGIGTSTPSGSRLHVFIGNDGGTGTPGVILATSNGANDIVRFQDGTTTVAVVKNNGNIGILNTDPQARLHIGSALASSSDITNGFILKQTSTNETTGIYLERSGERKGYAIYVGGSLDSLNFQRNNAGTKADVMALTRDGKVGINDTTPDGQLTVRSSNNVAENNLTSDNIGMVHNSNTSVGAQAIPGGFIVVRDKATAVANGDCLGGLAWHARYDTENRAGFASILAYATGSASDAASIAFNTSNGSLTTAERMRITNNGYLRLAGAGIQFNGDTADANSLDDYEEGTWTPVIGGSGGQSGQSYSGQAGWYIKIGRQVTVTFRVVLTNKGTITGEAGIKNLPFTADNTISFGSGATYFEGLATSWNNIFFMVNGNSTFASFDGTKSAGTATTRATTSDIGNGTQFNGSFTYLTV